MDSAWSGNITARLIHWSFCIWFQLVITPASTSLLPAGLFFFPLIPDPICWEPFMRVTDKEELLLWTCFSTALSGEALSPIRFWADPLSHSCLLTSFIYKAINSKMKASENPIWKWHKNWPGSAPTNMSRHGITLSSRSIYLCKYWMPQKNQSLSSAHHDTLPGEFCLLLALSLCTPSQVSSSSPLLNNLFLLAPMAYFPHYWEGIKPQVTSSGTAFNHGGYYQISYKRMLVCWYIHVLFCLWKCQRNTFRKRLILIWITFQKVSILPKFPGLDISQKLAFLAVFL